MSIGKLLNLTHKALGINNLSKNMNIMYNGS